MTTVTNGPLITIPQFEPSNLSAFGTLASATITVAVNWTEDI